MQNYVNYKLNYMTKDNMKKAIQSVEVLDTGGQTNIWAGLRET